LHFKSKLNILKVATGLKLMNIFILIITYYSRSSNLIPISIDLDFRAVVTLTTTES